MQRLTEVAGQTLVDFTNGIDHILRWKNSVFQLSLRYHVRLEPLLLTGLVQPTYPVVIVPIALNEVGGQFGMRWATIIRDPKRVSVPVRMP